MLSLKVTNNEVPNKLFTNRSPRMAESVQDDLEITTVMAATQPYMASMTAFNT